MYASFEPKETFYQGCNNTSASSMKNGRNTADQLLDPDRMEIYQGISIPTKYEPTAKDMNDSSMPPVDGDPKSVKSMHMFSYNKCAPECCIDSPYSCDRGCVCITPKQYEFLDKRGANRNINGCTLEDRMY